ncbi:MAG: hypothetical protein QM690_04570 [Sphingobium sp.]
MIAADGPASIGLPFGLARQAAHGFEPADIGLDLFTMRSELRLTSLRLIGAEP